MKSRIRTFFKWLLLIWGGFSLSSAIVLGTFVAYQLGVANRVKDDTTSPRDVRFVLNWCGLGERRIKQVIHSHVSARSFTGDHLDAYAIKISQVDEADLASKSNESSIRWYRGDQLPQIIDETVRFVSAFHHEIPWFPTEAELRSSSIHVYPQSIYLHGGRPTSAELIFVRPSDKMVFYFGGKT
jgi:hypothetical protein